MDSFLYWYSQNNKTVIQFLCVCIGLVLIYFIYRMFFAQAETATEGDGQITSKQIADLDNKISKIIDHQFSAAKPVVFTGEASEYEAMAESQSLQDEVVQLKKELQSSIEIVNLRTEELNAVKEKLIDHQKTLPGVQTTDLTAEAALTGDPALVAQITELKRKLEEYDIISDDIAELQNLRVEIAELKAKAEEKASAG